MILRHTRGIPLPTELERTPQCITFRDKTPSPLLYRLTRIFPGVLGREPGNPVVPLRALLLSRTDVGGCCAGPARGSREVDANGRLAKNGSTRREREREREKYRNDDGEDSK